MIVYTKIIHHIGANIVAFCGVIVGTMRVGMITCCVCY